jgi:hypothetical protein
MAMIASIVILTVLVLCAVGQAWVILRKWNRAYAGTKIRAVTRLLTFLLLANYYVAAILIPIDLDRGSALHGKVTPDGHYFMNKRGTYFEVSPAQYQQAFDFEQGSRIAAYIGLGALLVIVILPKMRPKGPPPGRPTY